MTDTLAAMRGALADAIEHVPAALDAEPDDRWPLLHPEPLAAALEHQAGHEGDALGPLLHDLARLFEAWSQQLQHDDGERTPAERAASMAINALYAAGDILAATAESVSSAPHALVLMVQAEVLRQLAELVGSNPPELEAARYLEQLSTAAAGAREKDAHPRGH